MSELDDVIPEGAVPIESLSELGNMVVHWFLEAQQRAQHVLNMPEGIAIDTKGEDGEVNGTMTPEQVNAFKLGIVYTMDEIFGNLPFLFQTENEEVTEDVTEPEEAEITELRS